jgi:hypothetical protein
MALPTLDATFASSADLPRRQMLAKWLVEELGSGSIADYYDLPERYLWAKIAVAAGAPREEADYISLPKNYAWSDIYNAVSGDIANSTVVVSGAGTASSNGTYVRNGSFDGRSAYNFGANFIIWSSGDSQWFIFDEETIGDNVYTSSDDTTYPWQATGWTAIAGSNPVPTLTPQTPNHTDWSENVALGHIAAAYRGDAGNPANLATYIDWPWRYKIASIIGAIGNGAGNWTPSQITTSIWLDASDASTISVSSGILAWNDKSGNGHHFTATSSTNSPTYSGTRNGLNVINFDNETNSQFVQNTTYTNGGTEIHVFSAHINTPTSAASSYGRLISLYKNGGEDFDNNNSILLAYAQPLEDPDGIVFYRNNSYVESSAVSGQWCIVDAQRSGTDYKIALNAETYITGSTEADNFDIDKVRIGFGTIFQTGLTGYVAEKIVLNYVPTQSVVEKIQGYLAHKWGLAGSLPLSHPYKNATPTI